MNSYRTKLGKELQVGDVLIWHTNGKEGLRLAKITKYTGKYADGVCGVGNLVGAKHGAPHSDIFAIMADEKYLIHHDSPAKRWPL